MIYKLLRKLFCFHRERCFIGTSWSGDIDRGGYWNDTYTCKCGATILIRRPWKQKSFDYKRRVILGNGKVWIRAAKSWRDFDLRAYKIDQKDPNC